MITIISLASIPASAQYFTDVNIGHWARESINYATDNGYIDSASTYTFNPDGNFTRADVAKMIYRLENSPNIAVTSQFTDVSASASYAKAVSWMVANGIMNGTSSTTFAPNAGIKRQDLALVFFRYGGYLEDKENAYIKYNVMSKRADISGFTDASTVNAYAREAVKWAVATNIITGEVGGVIEPKKVVVRETGAEFLKRFGIFVEGINFSRDIYGFTNNDFEYDNYYITNQHKSILYNYLENTGELDDEYDNDGLTVRDRIDAKINTPYGGSCFGVALTTLLNKVGKLDYTRHFGGTSADYLSDIVTLSGNAALESAINYYQFSLFATGVRNDRIASRCWKQNSSSAWKDWIEDLPGIIDENGLILLSFGFATGTSTSISAWHAVIIYDYKINTNGYTFYIYDPNFLSRNEITATNVIESGVNTISLQYGSQTILACDYLCDFSNIYHRYNRYDLDSYYNDFNAGASSTLNMVSQEYVVELFDEDTNQTRNGLDINEPVPYYDTIPR